MLPQDPAACQDSSRPPAHPAIRPCEPFWIPATEREMARRVQGESSFDDGAIRNFAQQIRLRLIENREVVGKVVVRP